MMTVKAVVVFLCAVTSSLIQPGEAQSAGLEFPGKLPSYAEYEPWNWRPNAILQFFFKTSSKKTAMVFYQDDDGENQFMDLFLLNGGARFRAKIGQEMTKFAERSIRHDFADSKWHKVKIELSDKEIKFSIDVSEDKIFNAEPIAFTKYDEATDNGGLFVAGIPPKSKLEWSFPSIFGQVWQNFAFFEGCIGDIRFNRVPNGRLERARLLHSVLATDTCKGACASRPQRCANGGSCIDRIRDSECDCTGIGYEGDSCTQRPTVVFMDGTAAYMSYSLYSNNSLRSTDRNALDFMFLTETKDGVFFYMGRDQDHLLVELVNGSLRAQADFGKGPVSVQSGGNLLSDSCWHHVEIRRRKRRLTVTIDRGETGKYHANSSEYFKLDLNNQSNVIYFGGGPSGALPFAKAKPLFFKGYLQKFRFEGRSVLERALGNRDGFSQIGVLEVYENNVQLQQAAENCQTEESGCSPSEDDSDSCNLSTTPTIGEPTTTTAVPSTTQRSVPPKPPITNPPETAKIRKPTPRPKGVSAWVIILIVLAAMALVFISVFLLYRWNHRYTGSFKPGKNEEGQPQEPGMEPGEQQNARMYNQPAFFMYKPPNKKTSAESPVSI